MTKLMVGALGFAALGLSGCATLNSPEAFQNAAAQKQDCKVVAFTNGIDSLRLAAKRDVGSDGTAMQRTEGKLEIGQAVLHPPQGTASTGPLLERTTSKLQRDC